MNWYAHSWYFFPAWMHELEIGYDIRHWMLGVSFAGKLYTVRLGPLLIGYRTGL